ncbi:MAG: hypothetical protein P8R04_07685 [Gammaproteobacteria bacterium]|nr:hypothetical protein [Gammaproteobacteria bacterium]
MSGFEWWLVLIGVSIFLGLLGSEFNKVFARCKSNEERIADLQYEIEKLQGKHNDDDDDDFY